MTKPQTDITILDEAAIAEIEARTEAATKGDWTIRGASWTDGGVKLAGYGIRFVESPETYTGWDARTNFPPETPEGQQAGADRSFLAHARADIPALCATVRALRAQYESAVSDFAAEINSVRAQLEQVTKERDEEKRLRSELKEIARAGFDDISSLGATLKENAVIDFRSRAIALCRDKADEWQSLFDGDVTGDHDDKTYYARAANKLASELEQLK